MFIYDKITLFFCVENMFNPTSEVQNIENVVFQNAPFANGRFPNGGYSFLWTQLTMGSDKDKSSQHSAALFKAVLLLFVSKKEELSPAVAQLVLLLEIQCPICAGIGD